jgi:glycosyltransferase involved in cell wall biosynthesis
MTAITAIIISLNEADRIGETVASLGFCDEILVVDAGSSDQTREIARRRGARVVTREWRGYSDQKNYAAREASHDWVLSIDADERPSIELGNEIVRWKETTPVADLAGVSMPRRAFYVDRWIGHSGWYPDRKVRLYDRTRGAWEGDFVHEGLQVNGRVERFDGDLLHFPYRSIQDHHDRIDRYTALSAEQSNANRRHFNPLKLAFGPVLFFVKTFFLQRGFLDGRQGVRIAYMGARYVFLKEFRILR